MPLNDLDEEALNAAKSGDVDRLKSLIRQGAKFSDEIMFQNSILKQVTVVRVLVEDAKIDVKSLRSDGGGWTPRYKCYLYGYAETEKYLKSVGVKLRWDD